MVIEAVVIKKTSHREHDQLVTLYCRELGKMTAIAKSILKPHSTQALALDEGNTIHCELVSGKGAPIITGAQAIRCLSGAKSSSLRWAAAQFFLQVIDTMVFDQQADEALWGVLVGTLAKLDASDEPDARTVLASFRECQRQFLEVLGYGYPQEGEMDDIFENIAQRKLATIGLFYGIVDHYARRI